jgi:phospholipid transport system transporter-binding protein
MPSTEAAVEEAAVEQAAVERNGDVLRFSGALVRAHCASLWRQSLPLLPGVRRFGLEAVTRADSAGIALLAELAARADDGISFDGEPGEMRALRTAYRLGPTLEFA